jgi:Zn-dependent protease
LREAPRSVDENTIVKLFTVALVVYGTSLHEMGHAFVAHWFGDPTPARNGRITLNPIPHLQPVVTAVIFPFISYMFGNSLFCLATTPIDPSKLKHPLRDHAIVAIAGPTMNFLLMGILVGVLWIPGTYSFDAYTGSPKNWIAAIFPIAALWNFILGCFNLLPIPPLDGYRIARIIMPIGLRRQADEFAKSTMSFFVVMILGSLIFMQISEPLIRFFITLLPARNYVL